MSGAGRVGLVLAACFAVVLAACTKEGSGEAAAIPRSPETIARIKECGGAEDPASIDVRLNRDVQPILDLNCVACHQSGSATEGLVLESGKSFAALVGKPANVTGLTLVRAGDPSGSYVLHKLRGTQKDVGGKGERMPFGGQLDEASIRTICRWIAEGALDN